MAKFQIIRLEATNKRPAFDCEDNDLNEFFINDSKHGCLELLAVTYMVTIDSQVVAFFSLSNDSINRELTGSSSFKRITRPIPYKKRYASQPAVKIGRFAVAKNFQSQGIGTDIIDFIKDWFTFDNKTGCRFITVDAYQQAITFYQKNGFDFLTTTDKKEQTRAMYFDLITITRSR